MSRRNCCVVDCRNTGQKRPEGTKFYSFPRENDIRFPGRRDHWVNLVRRRSSQSDSSRWFPSKNSFICSHHFVGGKKSDHPLSPSYHPSIFPDVYHKKPSKNADNDLHRSNTHQWQQKQRKCLDSSTDSDDSSIDFDVVHLQEAWTLEDYYEERTKDKSVQADLAADFSTSSFAFSCDMEGLSVGILCYIPSTTAIGIQTTES